LRNGNVFTKQAVGLDGAGVAAERTTVPSWGNPTMIVTIDSKRRLTVPAGLVPATGAPVSPGDYFDARFDAEEERSCFGGCRRRRTG